VEVTSQVMPKAFVIADQVMAGAAGVAVSR
jgi:hypothetical protein